MLKAKYIIVGNSIAAINAVEAIREIDDHGSMVLISDERYHVYSRPLISYYLSKKIDEDRMSYRPASFYKDYKVRTYLGKKVINIDTSGKKITLEDQTQIQFEKLLLTTGGEPFVPDTPGRDLKGIFNFTTLEDAHCLKKFITDHKVKKVVVVGGGLIGLKVTEALLSLNIQTSIVELADRILSATFDRTASKIIEKALNKTGSSIITCNTVKEFLGGQHKRVAVTILEDNTKIDCDLVIIAIGVRPRLDLIKGTEIKSNKGILVDNNLQTSEKDIYAAGDVAEVYDFVLNTYRPMAILPNAARQGKIAGFNMAGEKRKYEGSLAMNSIEIAGIPTISVGLTDPSILSNTERQKGIEVLQYCQEDDSIYKRIIIEKNRIIGMILIGKIDRAGIYTGLIKDKIDISSFKEHLLKDDFGLLSLPKEYRKHLVTGQGIEV